MQISDTQVKKMLEMGDLVREIDLVAEARQRAEDVQIVEKIADDVKAMGDREDRIAELKARVEAGAYAPTGAEIADAMIRRTLADRLG